MGCTDIRDDKAGRASSIRRARQRLFGALALTALIVFAPADRRAAAATASRRSGPVVLYVSTGPVLTEYVVDVDHATLSSRASVTAPANVQYAWPHPSGRFLYAVWSDGLTSRRHGVTAFAIDPVTGALRQMGASVDLRARPIHVTTDRTGAHLLIAYNLPPAVTVHRLGADGAIGAEIPQDPTLDFGVYVHQVRVEPSTGAVIVCAMGDRGADGSPGGPGALKVFALDHEHLASRGAISPGGGRDFQPRHLDFDPRGKRIFVTLEPQNKMAVFAETPSGAPAPDPLFTIDSLQAPADIRYEHRQLAGAIHVHPNGRFVYQADRGTGTTLVDGVRVWAGGSNSIGVFAIDQQTGEPRLLQNADTHGLVPRTFALDPSGRLLIAANSTRMLVREGAVTRDVPPNLTVFRIRPADGRLDYVSTYDIAGNQGAAFWMGVLTLPQRGRAPAPLAH